MYSAASLTNSLNAHLVAVQHQIQIIFNEAKEKNVDPYHMRKDDGSPLLSDLLLAKAQVLNGLATLAATRKAPK